MQSLITNIITNFIENQSLIILFIVFIYIYLNKDIKIIKKDLNNHVTGTEKKIEKLTENLNQLSKEINKDINRLKDNMSEKLDTNFNRLNERLDKAFGSSNRDNVSK